MSSIQQLLQHQKDQTSLSFNDPSFMRMFGELTFETVLDYFALSPFYDPKSVNEIIRVQQQDRSHLSTMPGIAFDVREALSKPPDFFIIVKLYRHENLTNYTDLSFYYIYRGSIFQVPSSMVVLQSRLFNMSYSLDSLLAKFSEATQYSLSEGYQLKLAQKEEEAQLTESDEKAASDVHYMNSTLLNSVLSRL
ncbi:hypothetical protein P9112_012177 [Eukaryota sp. TZLM1-RC]